MIVFPIGFSSYEGFDAPVYYARDVINVAIKRDGSKGSVRRRSVRLPYHMIYICVVRHNNKNSLASAHPSHTSLSCRF